MKRKWLGLALAALASAGVAFATEYTDSSANYPGDDAWKTGSNGGSGFGAWTIATTTGGDGWAGCGIWDPSANEFQGSWAGKTAAFGLMGKGDGFSVTASRAFRKALAVGDSFSLEMAVNWDSNREGAKKGFVLTAGGSDIVTVNHGAYPGKISINGDDSSDILNASGQYPMVWTFTAKDATTLSVTATPRDGSSEVYEADLTGLSTSAIDGFRLQSAEQDNQNEDRRQSYYDNFKLDIAGDLPDLVTLGFDSGDWAVASASQTLYYTLTRSSSAGALDVTVSSSDESFVAGKTVSFADGDEAVKFELEATLTGSGNIATITASAVGCDPATYEVKGPGFECSAEGSEEPWIMAPEEKRTLKVHNRNHEGVHGDDALVTVVSQDDEIVSVSALGEWGPDEGEGQTVASCTVTGVGGGWAPVEVFYDGVKMCDYGFTVIEAGATLSGPTSLRVGNEATYTLAVTLAGDIESDTFRLVAEPEDLVSIDPADWTEQVTESRSLEFTVTALAEGEVTLKVLDQAGLQDKIDPLTVTITKAPDYSTYVAYDDASFYGESFDFAATGAGIDGFQAWSVYKDSAEYGGAIVTTADGGFPAILSDGSAFAIYANGSNPDYAIVRPFVNDLQPGQKASIEFAVPQEGGSRYIQFARIWEGTPYNRCEIWASGGKVGVNVDNGESQELSWTANARRVVASVQLAADGSEYTLSLEGYNEGSEFADDVFQYSIDSNVGSWGDGLQGIVIGGYDLASDFIFNKLAIEQVEEPVKVRAIGFSEATYNPDVAEVPYTFAIGATTDDIGVVNLSVTPDDGGLVLSATSVNLTGTYEAEFTVTVSVEALPAEGEGTKYTITATPVDDSVAAATYDVTPRAPYIYLTSDNWEYNDDQGAIWVTVHATPSHFGTYYVTVDPAEGVLGIPELSQTIEINAANQDACAFDLTVVGAGEANVYIAHEGALDPSADFHFLIHSTVDPSDEPTIDGTTVVNVKFSNGFSAEATEEFKAQFTDVRAQRLEWNGSRDSGFEPVGNVLENQATWPEMKFDLDDPNATLRFIFVK